MYVRAPVSPCLDLVLLGDNVPEADLLRAVETKIRLFIELRGPIGIGWHGAVLKFEALLCGFCECACGAGEAAEVGERRMGWCEERHD